MLLTASDGDGSVVKLWWWSQSSTATEVDTSNGADGLTTAEVFL
jgi:hypothetical protein